MVKGSCKIVQVIFMKKYMNNFTNQAHFDISVGGGITEAWQSRSRAEGCFISAAERKASTSA
ncbi:hypothetical protein GCM10009504_05030 [Pseudomonas laurentiana]|nr:hypothetical protein GCM10009504_05030 [Pseudomonas laurentiana]